MTRWVWQAPDKRNYFSYLAPTPPHPLCHPDEDQGPSFSLTTNEHAGYETRNQIGLTTEFPTASVFAAISA